MNVKLFEVFFSIDDDEKCMVIIEKYNMNHSEIESEFIFNVIQEFEKAWYWDLIVSKSSIMNTDPNIVPTASFTVSVSSE